MLNDILRPRKRVKGLCGDGSTGLTPITKRDLVWIGKRMIKSLGEISILDLTNAGISKGKQCVRLTECSLVQGKIEFTGKSLATGTSTIMLYISMVRKRG